MSRTPIIDEHEAQVVRTHLDKTMAQAVRMDLFVSAADEDCVTCDEAEQLLEETAALSPKLELAVHDVNAAAGLAEQMGVERVPALVLTGASRGRVRYFGVPSGLEFIALLKDLSDVSRGDGALSEPTRAALGALDRDVHIQVFVTPDCPYCPQVARLAHRFAVENHHITADVVEVSEFPELGDRYEVLGVPKVVINDRVSLTGAHKEPKLVSAVLEAVQAS